jgi:hypothetical protein
VITEARRLYVPQTPFGAALETSGHGAWRAVPGRAYTAFFRFLLQQAPPSAGAPLGTDNVRLNIRLDRTGNHFSGRFESTVRDTTGAAIFTAAGNITGDRIVA